VIALKRVSVAFAMMLVILGTGACEAPVRGTVVAKEHRAGGPYRIHVKEGTTDKWQSVTRKTYDDCQINEQYPDCEVN
jgi:hypothetical protein